MKSKIVLIALTLFSAQASAGWELVTEAADGDKFYIDLSTKRKQGVYTLVWTMDNYAKAQESASQIYWSAKSLNVFKCTEMQIGVKSNTRYSGNHGAGEIVSTYASELFEIKFFDVMPGSVGESLLSSACKGS